MSAIVPSPVKLMDDIKLEAIEEKTCQYTSKSLSTKVVRGGVWLFSSQIVKRLLRLIRTVILARLLAPHDFGLFGIALLTISMLEAFSQTGFQAALVQRKEDVESYLDTAWTMAVIRGIFLFSILFFAAPLIARFFGSIQASLVIKVIAISTLLSGFNNVGIIFFRKELEFNKLFLYEVSGTLADLITAITLALILRNVWALVWGGLAADFIWLVMSYLLHPYRPSFCFDKQKFQHLFRFGRWILGSSILLFFINQGDDIFVGKMIGVTSLGLYQMAYLISNLPTTEITHVISHVTFPAYSKLQNDLLRLREAYLKVFRFTVFLSFPVAGGILILAPDFTQIFLGSKWMPMVPTMQVLAVYGLIRSTGAATGPLFHALGRPQLGTKLHFAKLILFLIIIYPLTIRWGILGTALAVVLNALLISPFAHCLAIRAIDARGLDLVSLASVPAFSTIMMYICLSLTRKWLLPHQCLTSFIAFVLAGSMVYFTTIIIFDKKSVQETYQFFKKRLEIQ